MLAANKTILFGSDVLSKLSRILKVVQKIPEYRYVSATASQDVVEMIDMISPGLVVLSFEDNHSILKEIGPILEGKCTPVLCLFDSLEEFSWSKYSIVFAQELERVLQKDRLMCVIHSILMLQHRGQQNLFQTTLFSEALVLQPAPRSSPAYQLELAHKVEVLKKVRGLIKDLYDEVDDPVKNRLLSIGNIIKASISDEKHWEDFKLQFNDTHNGFIESLKARHPNLTNRDIKYCCYLKIGMSNEDIRHVLGINQESVSTHKYRLKRKLHLIKAQSLRGYIDQFNH